MKLKRITVEEVRAAYEKTGLKPVNRDWGDGVQCGCPLTAVLVDSGMNPEFIDVHGLELYSGDAYCEGFIDAIDELGFSPTVVEDFAEENYGEGYADGLAVRQAIFDSQRPKGAVRDPSTDAKSQ